MRGARVLTATLCALAMASCTPVPEKKADGRVDEPLPATPTTEPSLPPGREKYGWTTWTRARCSHPNSASR